MTSLPHYDIVFHFVGLDFTMYLVAIGWMYVVLMMAAAEAMAPNGTILGAVFTLLLYGLMPLALVLYLMATPARRRARRVAEKAGVSPDTPESFTQPDGRGETAGSPVAPVRKEP